MKDFEKIALAAWSVLALTAAVLASGAISLAGLAANTPLCLFKLLTGWPCPGCGMGHALLLAFQGQWRESLSEHPLGLGLWGIWTAWVLIGLVNRAKGRGIGEGFPKVFAKTGFASASLFLLLAVYAAKLWAAR